MPSSRPVLWSSSFICLTTLLEVVKANSVTKAPFRLILSPIHSAILALSLLFILVFFIQSLSSLGKLGRSVKPLPSGRRGAVYFVGKPYFFIILFVTLSLVAYNVLFAVTVIYTLNESVGDLKPVSSSFIAGRDFVLRMAQWFIFCALLVLFFERERFSGKNEKEDEVSRGRSHVYKVIVDGVILLALLAVIVASAGLEGSYQTSDRKRSLDMLLLSRAYIALQAILTFYVIASAIRTWFKLKNESIPDSIMIGQTLKYISPFLFLQTIFKITDYALVSTSGPRFASSAALDALLLSNTLVIGVTNFIILWFAS